MAITIKCEQMEDGLILVNGKEVRRDMNGDWIGQSLEIIEAKYFNQFLQTIKRISGEKLRETTYKA